MAAVPSSRDWVILDRFVRRRDDGYFPEDNPTAAFITNSRGDPFAVCLDLNAPPRPSNLILWWPKGPTGWLEPVAAHGGAVLLLMQYAIPVLGGPFRFPMIDYFLYSPSNQWYLRRLPPLGGTIEEVQARVEAEGIRASRQILRRMEFLDIGIILRSLNDFAVAELALDVTDEVARPEVRVFNPAASDHWVLNKPRVIPVSGNDDLDMDQILWYWETDAVVPWGNYLCWVDYSAGIMMCNVFDQDPDIRFLELPARKYCLHREGGMGKGNMNAYHTLGTTNNGNALKFAFVLCHDAVVKQTQNPDSFAFDLWHDAVVKQTQNPDSSNFTVTTWALTIDGGSMLWVEDSQITAYDLWEQDDFTLTPRDLLLYPTFSVDDPNEVSFVLKHEPTKQEDGTYDAAQIWMVSIDMIKKKFKSSIVYVKDSPDEAELFERKSCYLEPFLPVEVPKGLI